MNYLKSAVALCMFLGCLYQVYETVVKREYLKPKVSRNAEGFVVDRKVKIVVDQEVLQAYQEFLKGATEQVALPKEGPPTPAAATPTEKVGPAEMALAESKEDQEKVEDADELVQSSPSNSKPEEEVISQAPLPPLPSPGPAAEVEEPLKKITEEKPKTLAVSCETKNSDGRIPPEVWEQKVKESGMTKYKLTEVMSLSDISIQVFGEESCWPKIWSFNPQIGNPYDLPAGEEIFFTHQEQRAPAAEQ